MRKHSEDDNSKKDEEILLQKRKMLDIITLQSLKQQTIMQYEDCDASFQHQQECTLLNKLIERRKQLAEYIEIKSIAVNETSNDSKMFLKVSLNIRFYT